MDVIIGNIPEMNTEGFDANMCGGMDRVKICLFLHVIIMT